MAFHHRVNVVNDYWDINALDIKEMNINALDKDISC